MSFSLTRSEMTTKTFVAGNDIVIEDFNDISGGLQFNVKKELRIAMRHLGGNFIVRRLLSAGASIDGLIEADDSFEPSQSGNNLQVKAGTAYINGVRYTTALVSLHPGTASNWLNGAISDGVRYIYASADVNTPNTAGFYWSTSANLDNTTSDGFVLLAQITVSGGNVTAATDMRSRAQTGNLDGPLSMIYDTTGDADEQASAALKILRQGASTGPALELEAESGKNAMLIPVGHLQMQNGNILMPASATVDGIDISEIKLNSMPSAASGDISCNTQKLTGVVDPTSAQDAATKNYVDTTLAQTHTVNVHPNNKFPSNGETSGNNNVYWAYVNSLGSIWFGRNSQTTGNRLTAEFILPDTYTDGDPVSLRLVWRIENGGGADSVSYQAIVYYSGDGEALQGPALNASSTWSGNGEVQNFETLTITPTNLQKGDLITALLLMEDDDNAADTRLMAMWLEVEVSKVD